MTFDPSEFDYALPPERIAQRAAEPRDAARLLVLDRAAGTLAHKTVRDLPQFLRPGDLIVANDTRVLPARLSARRATGGRVEVMLVQPGSRGGWEALIRSGGRVKPGDTLTVGEQPEAAIHVVSCIEGRWTVKIEGADAAELMTKHGKAPLPPYIKRPLENDPDRGSDLERYQTVFAREPGAVAAPTAGLHFTPALLETLKKNGVGWATVTLHVGTGTFKTAAGSAPDPERAEVPEATAQAVRDAKARGGRVVAVGTTSTRALETWAQAGMPPTWTGETKLVILPGFEFKSVDILMTNFHLPQTSLLALVCALAGRERILAAYAEAVRLGYRFYSYGDAMLIL